LLPRCPAAPAAGAGLTLPNPLEAEAAPDHPCGELRAPSGEQGRPLQVDRRVERRL
jgi:hypothetical protein